MNYLLLPTLLIAIILFWFRARCGNRNKKGRQFFLQCGLGAMLAMPGVLFAVYYLGVFREPVWLYRFRSVSFTELAASGAGFFAGLLHGKFSESARFRRFAGRWLFAEILAIGLLVPYLKPIMRPPRWNEFQDRWSDDVCLQTSESSCGPACVATLLRRFAKMATEEQVARASFTSRSGTENWYLARTLRKFGFDVRFLYEPDVNKPWPFPAIAGVQLPGSGKTGHFITVLDRIGDKYVIGDPLEGKTIQSQSALRRTYDFTGFFMIVK